jgi:hypothetical protein
VRTYEEEHKIGCIKVEYMSKYVSDMNYVQGIRQRDLRLYVQNTAHGEE